MHLRARSVLARLHHEEVETGAGKSKSKRQKANCKMIFTSCMLALMQVRAQIERAQALAAKLSDQTTVSSAATVRQLCSAFPGMSSSETFTRRNM